MHGIDTIIAPLFELEYLHPEIPSRQYQAVIFTSRHSARNFVENYPIPAIPAFCVGNETAAVLKDAGFSQIHSANGDMIDLYALICATVTDKTAPLLRLHADLDDDPLYDRLVQDHYDVTRLAFYVTHPVTDMPEQAILAIENNEIDGICFYSPNAARHFTQLIMEAELSEACRPLTAWCISENTRVALDLVPFGHISVSDHPSHQAMVRAMHKTMCQNCD